MTLAQARSIFSGRPQFSSSETREAVRVLAQVEAAKKVVVRNATAKAIRRAEPGSGYSKQLRAFQADVVEAAYAELGVA
jgi:predicted aconitase